MLVQKQEENLFAFFYIPFNLNFIFLGVFLFASLLLFWAEPIGTIMLY